MNWENGQHKQKKSHETIPFDYKELSIKNRFLINRSLKKQNSKSCTLGKKKKLTRDRRVKIKVKEI